MKSLILLGLLFSSSLFAAEDVCVYDGTVYHAGDSFSDRELCNTCSCEKSYYGPGLGMGCTESACFGPIPKKDITPFFYATTIVCQKVNKQKNYIWELKLEDLDHDGEYVLTATRNGQVYYSRNYANHYLTVKMAQYDDRLRFYSPAGTVFVDLTRAYEGESATAYFSSERFNKNVSNLRCKAL